MARFFRREVLLAPFAAFCPAVRGSREPDTPIVDYHVHLRPSFSLEDAVALSEKRGVKFGILEHAGAKENRYPVILSNDQELQQWIAKLDGKPVYKGIQAEWLDWMTCFSKDVVAQLDYVLSDAMTIPGAGGERVMMWRRGYDPGNAQEFMERYVKWNVEVIETEPLDIFAHPTWLPAPLDQSYDALWTAERMQPVIRALKQTGTAVEIDSDFNIPRMPFLKAAKEEGLKFAFGSNSGTGRERSLEFCIETARALGLEKKDFFVPAPRGRKPIERRKLIR
jgi:histidinol phosphatase-like PHP family hydrolase